MSSLITDDTSAYSVALTKDFYGQRLYNNVPGIDLTLANYQDSGTVTIGDFGKGANVKVYKSPEDLSVVDFGFGSLTLDLWVGRDATITGSAYIGTDISVAGQASVTGNLAVGSDATISGSAYVGTDLIVKGQASVTGNLAIGSSASIAGSAYFGTDINVGGQASITGNLNVGSSASISGSLTVKQDAYVLGSATISGNLETTGTVTAAAFASTGSVSSFPGHVDVGSNLMVHQNTTISGNLFVGLSSTIAGSLTVLQDIYGESSGTILGNLYVGSSATIAGSLAVLQDFYGESSGTILGNLYVGTGATIADSLRVGTNITVGGQASVTGNLAVGSSATVAGSLWVGTDAFVHGQASISGSLNVGTNATVAGSLWVGTDAFIHGQASITGSLNVGTNATVAGSLWVGTDAFVHGQASITGSLNVGTNATIAGSLWIGTDLHVAGDATITDSLAVLNSVAISTNLTVGGFGSVSGNFYSGGTLIAPYGSITNLVAENAVIMSNLIVEGTTQYINTTVSTQEDLNLQMGVFNSRRVTASDGTTYTLDAVSGDPGNTYSTNTNIYGIMTPVDQLLTTTDGNNLVLEITSCVFSSSTNQYQLQFTAHKPDGSSAPVTSVTDVGLTANYSFSGNVVTFSLLVDPSLYGKPGFTFNTYSSLSGQVTNTSREIIFGEQSLELYRQDDEVIDLNLSGIKRAGTTSTPAYSINNQSLLTPYKVSVDTTFDDSSAIYLNATGTNTDAIGTWRMRIDPASNRFVVQLKRSTGWRTGLSVVAPS